MFIKACLISTGALALAMTAAAQSFSPAPTTNAKLWGTLTLSQSITISCDVHIEFDIDAAGQATVTSRTFAPGDNFCGGVVQPFGTWTLSPDNPTQVSATVGSTSILGTCVGTVQGVWDNAAGTLTFNSAIVPGTPAPCTVNGTLTSMPQLSIP